MKDKSLLIVAAVVLVHLVITFAHGAAHATADVQLGAWGMAFVLAVIELGPILGLVWMRWNRVAGAWLVAAAMFGALLFGLVNHFVIPGPDRVDAVTGPAGVGFRVTAVLLLISEAAGTLVAASYARGVTRKFV
jgi:hypothetical protein